MAKALTSGAASIIDSLNPLKAIGDMVDRCCQYKEEIARIEENKEKMRHNYAIQMDAIKREQEIYIEKINLEKDKIIIDNNKFMAKMASKQQSINFIQQECSRIISKILSSDIDARARDSLIFFVNTMIGSMTALHAQQHTSIENKGKSMENTFLSIKNLQSNRKELQ